MTSWLGFSSHCHVNNRDSTAFWQYDIALEALSGLFFTFPFSKYPLSRYEIASLVGGITRGNRNRQVCYFRKTGTTRARFPVCDCFSNVCLTHMDGTENHSRNDLIPLVRLRIRCDHSRNRMSTQDTYLRNANQVCKARKPRSYCSLMFEHFMVDCSALLKQVPNSFGFETCYGWRPFARLVVAGCHPDTA